MTTYVNSNLLQQGRIIRKTITAAFTDLGISTHLLRGIITDELNILLKIDNLKRIMILYTADSSPHKSYRFAHYLNITNDNLVGKRTLQ